MNNRSYETFLAKARAPYKVAQAIRKGILTRPSECSSCQTTGRIEGHHSDYTKPLEVIWVCTPCHNKIHSNLFHLSNSSNILCKRVISSFSQAF